MPRPKSQCVNNVDTRSIFAGYPASEIYGPCSCALATSNRSPMRKRCSHWRKFALEAHALGDLKARDDTPLDLLTRLSGGFARSPILFSAGTGEKQIGRDQVAPIEVGEVPFRGSVSLSHSLDQGLPIHIVIFHDIRPFSNHCSCRHSKCGFCRTVSLFSRNIVRHQAEISSLKQAGSRITSPSGQKSLKSKGEHK